MNRGSSRRATSQPAGGIPRDARQAPCRGNGTRPPRPDSWGNLSLLRSHHRILPPITRRLSLCPAWVGIGLMSWRMHHGFILRLFFSGQWEEEPRLNSFQLPRLWGLWFPGSLPTESVFRAIEWVGRRDPTVHSSISGQAGQTQDRANQDIDLQQISQPLPKPLDNFANRLASGPSKLNERWAKNWQGHADASRPETEIPKWHRPSSSAIDLAGDGHFSSEPTNATIPPRYRVRYWSACPLSKSATCFCISAELQSQTWSWVRSLNHWSPGPRHWMSDEVASEADMNPTLGLVRR